jgi:hypothetical protein
MHEQLDEPIDVMVSFAGTKVKPTVFLRQGRQYHIDKVNMVYTSKEEGTKVYYFSVSNSSHYFKLRFNPATLLWRLQEIYWE